MSKIIYTHREFNHIVKVAERAIGGDPFRDLGPPPAEKAGNARRATKAMKSSSLASPAPAPIPATRAMPDAWLTRPSAASEPAPARAKPGTVAEEVGHAVVSLALGLKIETIKVTRDTPCVTFKSLDGVAPRDQAIAALAGACARWKVQAGIWADLPTSWSFLEGIVGSGDAYYIKAALGDPPSVSELERCIAHANYLLGLHRGAFDAIHRALELKSSGVLEGWEAEAIWRNTQS